MALTVKKIDSLKPKAQRYEVADGGGLYLVMHPSGKRSWALRYRAPGSGLARKLTFGEIDAPLARERAQDARKRIKAGYDPGTEALAAKALARDRSNVVGDLMDDYLEGYAKTHRESSHAEVARLFDKWGRPAIGAKRIEDVAQSDIEAILSRMAKSGAPVSANRLLAALRPFFASVRIGGRPLPHLPTADVQRPTDETGRDRDRVLTDSEIRWVWRATDDATAFSAAVRVMLLTGQRRGEVAGMVSAELDLEADAPVWLLPAARTKNGREHLVPLTPTVIEAIRRPPHVGRSKLVFTSTTGAELSGWSKSKAALDARMLAVATELTGRPPNIEPFTLHDLRRTCATGLARLRVPPHVIEAVLNHKTGQISRLGAIYNRHQYADEKMEAMQRWESEVNSINFRTLSVV